MNRVAVTTGLRRGQHVPLHWEDIDFQSHRLRTLHRQNFRTKGNRERCVPFRSGAEKALDSLYPDPEAEAPSSPIRTTNSSGGPCDHSVQGHGPEGRTRRADSRPQPASHHGLVPRDEGRPHEGGSRKSSVPPIFGPPRSTVTSLLEPSIGRGRTHSASEHSSPGRRLTTYRPHLFFSVHLRAGPPLGSKKTPPRSPLYGAQRRFDGGLRK